MGFNDSISTNGDSAIQSSKIEKTWKRYHLEISKFAIEKGSWLIFFDDLPGTTPDSP